MNNVSQTNLNFREWSVGGEIWNKISSSKERMHHENDKKDWKWDSSLNKKKINF